MKQFTFDKENFQPDYIALKFEVLDWYDRKQILGYLFKIGFNTYSGLPPKANEIRTDPKKKFKIYVTENIPDWNGTVIHFTGKNAKQFYDLLKGMVIEVKIFQGATLARFDLAYLRYHKKTDNISVSQFLFMCFEKIRITHRKVSIDKNNAGLIQRIGHRKNNRCYRIYEDTDNKNFLKFEYELKSRALVQSQNLIFLDKLQDFEHQLSFEFINQFSKLLPLQYSYMDWLVYKLRPLRKRGKGTTKLTQKVLKTDYMVTKNFSKLSERRHFWNLLQFLVYVQELSYQTDYLGDIQYRQVTFPVQHFLEYKKESNNYYQVKKILQFFDELQTNSMIKFFTNNYYRSLVTIPDVKLFPGKQNRWTAEVWIAEELFYYAHPFFFPDFFQQKLTKHEFEVLFKVIQTFTSEENLEKVFSIKDYFKNYQSTLNNSQKIKIKNYFIQVIQQLKEDDLIENNYKIIREGHPFNTNKLTSKNINEGFIIYEKLNL